LKLSGYYSDHPNLCKKWDKVESGPLFANFTDNLLQDMGGSENVVVQKLENSFNDPHESEKTLLGLVNPLPTFPN
jgi:hypothetical protein